MNMAQKRAIDRYINTQDYQIKFWREYMYQLMDLNESMAEHGIDAHDPRRVDLNHDINNAGFAAYYHKSRPAYEYPENRSK